MDFLTPIAQQGVLFSLLVGIIFVLGKRVLTLEKKIDDLQEEKFDIVKEVLKITHEATNEIKNIIKFIQNGNI